MAQSQSCWAWSLLLLLCAARTDAAEMRTWTDSTGRHKVRAELVAVENGKVKLKLETGRELTLPLAKLSADDRAFLDKQSEAFEAPEAAATTPATDAPAAAPPAEVKKGTFTAKFEQHWPLAAAEQVMPRALPPKELAGVQQKLAAATAAAGHAAIPDFFYKIAEESWHVDVPPEYDGTPHGLLVWINAGDSGAPPADWIPILRKHRLIFAGANKSGNKEDVLFRRMPMALDAVFNLSQQYAIDRNRVYIGGISGGGRVASWLAMGYADVFSGGCYQVGANSYKDIPLQDGSFLPGEVHLPSPQLFNHARKNNRYVFLTGDKDYNREQMQKTAQLYQQDGFQFVSYLQVPGMGHAPAPADWLEKSIDFLDAPLAAGAADAYKQARQQLDRKQLGAALDNFGRAAASGGANAFTADAKQQYLALRAQYQSDLAAIQAALAASDRAKAGALLTEFRKRWAAAGKEDAQRLTEQMRKIK